MQTRVTMAKMIGVVGVIERVERVEIQVMETPGICNTKDVQHIVKINDTEEGVDRLWMC